MPNSRFDEHKLQNKVEKHNCIAVNTKSNKMFYVMQKAINDRNSLGVVLILKGKPQTIEIPLNELKLLSQDLNDILELYFLEKL